MFVGEFLINSRFNVQAAAAHFSAMFMHVFTTETREKAGSFLGVDLYSKLHDHITLSTFHHTVSVTCAYL
jgi:hypothetical protein